MMICLTPEERAELVERSELVRMSACWSEKAATIDALWEAIDAVVPDHRRAIAAAAERNFRRMTGAEERTR